jgi:2-oxoisovalerate dehydrogenase E1 component
MTGSDQNDKTQLLRSMMTIRKMEETILELRRQDQVAGSIHLCIGQESAPVGVLAALDERDRILTTYRGHGWALVRGVPMEQIFGEVLGKTTGTNGGRAGSAYFTSPEHGFVGENSIVAAGLPIANGVAMGLADHGNGGIAVVSFGDGATNQGGAHEALVFALARNLPVLFVCENNSWSEMTPITDTVPRAELHDRAAGYGMPSRWIDGTDVASVIDAAAEAVGRIRAGGGPEFLEIKVPRIFGHYNGDIQQYRSEDDKQAHKDRDPIDLLAAELQLGDELESLERSIAAEVDAALQHALAAPLADPSTAAEHVVSRGTFTALGDLPTEGKELAYGLAVNRALATELDERENVVVFGEDIAIPGGSFGVTRNLRKNHGERVFDTPISETAILGAAIGASLEGLRPVVEIMWTDFLLVAFDQIANQAANVRYISGGRVSAPLVIRMQQGITPGSCAQHSQSLEALIAHIPGIKLGMPSNAADAYAMTRAAVADEDPVVLIESRALYLEKGIVDLDAPVENVGGARRRRDGNDVLIVTWGRMTNIVLAAADELANEGIDATVLDLRWLAPLDDAAIAAAIAQVRGKVLVVHEANLTGGFGAEISARIAEHHYDALSGPIVRVGLPDVRVPSAPLLQEALMPSVGEIAAAARKLLSAPVAA